MENYDNALATSREAFFKDVNFESLNERQTVIALLLMYAKGIRMTEPVPYWIERAGQNAIEIGFEKCGAALKMHAEHEAGHHQMYRSDFKTMAQLWLEDTGEDLHWLLNLELGNQVIDDYILMHERVINGTAPYSQVAIELEIEGVSEPLGTRIVKHVESTLGQKYLAAMSFIEEHAELDVGHTRFNRGLLKELLEHPDVDLDAIVAAGRSALASFGNYLQTCIAMSKIDLKAMTEEQQRTNGIVASMVRLIGEGERQQMSRDQLFNLASAHMQAVTPEATV